MSLNVAGAIIWLCLTQNAFGFTLDRDPARTSDGLIQTQLIDLQNPETLNLLKLFNVSADQIKANRWAPATATDSTVLSENDNFSDIKQLRYHDIQTRINNAILGDPISVGNLPTHEMAAFPICTQVNTTSWKDENNLTIRFAPSLFETERPHMYLDTAVLRLFKVNPNPETEPTSKPNCDENPLQPQIRITISTIQHAKRNKREKKKRTCNTLMLNTTRTGWIEIDIKKAIYIWEKSERQTHSGYGNTNNNYRLQVMAGWLIIDVHDEDERQLKAGSYFEPPKCEEAVPAVPWNFYRQSFATSSMEKVPRSPRLDFKYIDNRSIYQFTQSSTHSTHRTHKRLYCQGSSARTILQTTTSENNLYSYKCRPHRRRLTEINYFHQQPYHHHLCKNQNCSIESDNTSEN